MVDRSVFASRVRFRLRTRPEGFYRASRALRHRDGRRVGRRRLADDGDRSAARAGFVSGLLQSGYPTGYFLASIVYGLLFPYIGWRGMFMVGVVPALLVLYIRRNVPELPGLSKRPRNAAARSRSCAALAPGHLRHHPDDRLQFLQPRHPGHLSHVPAGAAWVVSADREHHRGHRQYRRHHRRFLFGSLSARVLDAADASSSLPCSLCR